MKTLIKLIVALVVAFVVAFNAGCAGGAAALTETEAKEARKLDRVAPCGFNRMEKPLSGFDGHTIGPKDLVPGRVNGTVKAAVREVPVRDLFGSSKWSEAAGMRSYDEPDLVEVRLESRDFNDTVNGRLIVKTSDPSYGVQSLTILRYGDKRDYLVTNCFVAKEGFESPIASTPTGKTSIGNPLAEGDVIKVTVVKRSDTPRAARSKTAGTAAPTRKVHPGPSSTVKPRFGPNR